MWGPFSGPTQIMDPTRHCTFSVTLAFLSLQPFPKVKHLQQFDWKDPQTPIHFGGVKICSTGMLFLSLQHVEVTFLGKLSEKTGSQLLYSSV